METRSLNGSLAYIVPLYEAAERGEMAAQFLLADAFLTGSGININHQEALRLLTESAKQEFLPAITRLGDIYAFGGYGLPKTPANDAEALKWWRRAAELGEINCAIRVGAAYFHGENGCQQDFQQAYVWFGIAAAHDNSVAMQGKQAAGKHLTPEQISQSDTMIQELKQKISSEVAGYNERHATYCVSGITEAAIN